MTAVARSRSVILTIATLVALTFLVGHADAAIYWTVGGGIDRSNLDGSTLQERFIDSGPQVPLSPSVTTYGAVECEGVVVDGSHIYWAEPARGAIDRADLDGSNVDYDLVTGLENPCGVAVDSSGIYWTDWGTGTIGRANLEGGEAQSDFIGELGQPCGIAVGGGYLYWSSNFRYGGAASYIARVPVGGGIPQTLIESESLCGVAVDSTHLYWGGFGTTIGRSGLDGSDPEPSFIAGLDRPCGIALYGSRIYWMRQDPLEQGIQSTELEGPHAIQTLVPSFIGDGCGVAVDSTTVPLPPTPLPSPPASSSPALSIHSRHAKHRPITYVALEFGQAGTFTVSGGRDLSLHVISKGGAALTLAGPEQRVLKVSPASGNAAAKVLRRKLRRKGKARVAVSVNFAAADGTASSQREWLSLNEPRRRAKTNTPR